MTFILKRAIQLNNNVKSDQDIEEEQKGHVETHFLLFINYFCRCDQIANKLHYFVHPSTAMNSAQFICFQR